MNEYTYEFLKDKKYEIIGGAIILMAPAVIRHNTVTLNISTIFANYLKGKKCRVFAENLYVCLDKFDLNIGTKKDKLIPDVMVVCNTDLINPNDNGIHGAPDLVAEVLSPSTAKNDRFKKKDIRGDRRSGILDS